VPKRIFLILFFSAFFFGCRLSPISSEVGFWHQKAQENIPHLRQIVREGDIVFRLSQTQLAGGLIDFSKEIAKATHSRFSHAVLVYRVEEDGIILADITPNGVARRYMIDWYIEGCKVLAVKRLKPEYEHLVPVVLEEARRVIEQDLLYDDKFIPDDNRFYCSEFVDHCFRKAGYPLAPRIKIKDWPSYNLLAFSVCLIGGIDANNETAIVGNDEIGLFSSPMLFLVHENEID